MVYCIYSANSFLHSVLGGGEGCLFFFFFNLFLKSRLRSNFIMTSSLNVTGNDLLLFSIPILRSHLSNCVLYYVLSLMDHNGSYCNVLLLDIP